MTQTIDNEDWPKYSTWDLYRGSTLITTVEDLLWALQLSNAPLADQKAELIKFLELPAWMPAPEQLKREVNSFLEKR